MTAHLLLQQIGWEDVTLWDFSRQGSYVDLSREGSQRDFESLEPAGEIPHCVRPFMT